MKIALRIDDIGASSKKYEVYSKKLHGFGNILFLKYLPFFRAWGPYREISPQELEKVRDILVKFNAKLTVAVTACWVDGSGKLVPYHEKFPAQAQILKKGMDAQVFEIANHGLTHCIVEGLQFKPKMFESNRRFHREFYSWVSKKQQFEHIRRSQEILQGFFGTTIVTLVPPGNVFSSKTELACMENGIKTINCNTPKSKNDSLKIIGNDQVIAFHDREIVLNGVSWLERKLLSLSDDVEFVFVREL